MTDGLYFPLIVNAPRHQFEGTDMSSMDASAEDYYKNFALWIALQQVSTHAGLLEEIAKDLYRRRDYPTLASEIKHAAKILRAISIVNVGQAKRRIAEEGP